MQNKDLYGEKKIALSYSIFYKINSDFKMKGILLNIYITTYLFYTASYTLLIDKNSQFEIY
jgi:hypothetical protein